MDSDENISRRVPDQGVLFASRANVSGGRSRTRAIHDADTQESGEIPQVLLEARAQGTDLRPNIPYFNTKIWLFLPPRSPPAVSLRRRAVFELVPAFSSPRANHLVSIPNSELPLILTQKADASSPLSISVPQYPQLPVIPLAGAGSQVLFLLSMSEPFQPASESSVFLPLPLPLPYGLPFFRMGPAVIVLGAGAFVTTAAAGVILLRRKLLGKPVEIDLEKGPEENIIERRDTGPGWKEYIEVDEKGPYELLVGALSPRETDVADANRSPTPLPTLHQCPELPAPNVDPVPVLEGDISDTCAPEFPPGLPLPAKSVAVATPVPTRFELQSELNPLDTRVAGITSWPVLAPTPVEEMRTKAHGQGATVSDIQDDVVRRDQPPASSLKSCEPETTLNDSLASTLFEPVHEPDIEDPLADPPDLAHSPRSEVPPDGENSSSQSLATTLDDSDTILGCVDVSRPSVIDSASASSILCADPVATIPDTVFPANIPLPESPPVSLEAVSSLLVHTLPLDTVVSTTVIFTEEHSPIADVSDPEPSSLATEAPFVPVLTPIITTSCLEDTNEAPHSPLSDTSSSLSSSDSESSGPDTPTELKQDLPFSPVLELSSKATPGLQLSVCLPSEDAVDEDMELVDDFVIVEQQAPDPSSPTIDVICSQLKTPKFPGGFEDIVTESSVVSSEPKPTGASAVIEGPPLTADMVQLCHALMTVSNCAGLVAQAVVGFSVWWSLTLVPA